MLDPAELAPRPLPTWRVFLASTAVDLSAHRHAAADAILRLGDLPVRMETFGALPNTPVAACEQQVQGSDAVVVIVAHRYGWVPAAEQGGRDGKSITWLEVEAALTAKRPVFAFIVDDQYPWTEPKEQDRLQRPEMLDPEKAEEVLRAIRDLQCFKRWLRNDAGLVVESFTTPEDLAAKVTAALAKWAFGFLATGEHTPALSIAVRPAEIRVYHPLQPAPYFHGRATLIENLLAWWSDPAHSKRVRALVAAGGTGKTALAEQVLRQACTLDQRGHTLVWSFYENPDTDAFLREACDLFLGEREGPPGGRLERLERGLREGRPHFFVLDGLERLQVNAQESHALGEIEDHSVRLLLRAIAAGLGRTRALVTSRLPLSDLDSWKQSGYDLIRLDDLDRDSAVAVLRAWGVRGDDERLGSLADDVGHHALSVSVLGSFLASFGACDPAFADQLELRREAGDDPRAARLARILQGYADRLPTAERDLLVRLSLFPRGASLPLLRIVATARKKVAGALALCNEADLQHLARRIVERGLAFAYTRGHEQVFTAHPFLRDWFRQLLGRDAAAVHHAIRKALAPTLKDYARMRWRGWGKRNKPFPTDTEVLDRYEALIEHTRLSGKDRKAFWSYMFGLGGFSHLGETLGEYTRGARILSGFSTTGRPEEAGSRLSRIERPHLLNAQALFLCHLGQLDTAARHLAVSERLARKGGEGYVTCPILLNMAELARLRGRLPEACSLATEAMAQADRAIFRTYRDYLRPIASAYRAEIVHLLGAIQEGSTDFDAETLGPSALSLRRKLDLGYLDEARNQITESLSSGLREAPNRETARYHILLARVSLQCAIQETVAHLEAIQSWTAKSGDLEMVIEAHWISGDLARRHGDLPGARAEALAGVNHAEASGYRLLHIELLVLLARIHLAWPDAHAALQYARQALELATAVDCRYAWGEADAAHVCGEAHLTSSDTEQARSCFEHALAVRERIRHPATMETRSALDRCRTLAARGEMPFPALKRRELGHEKGA